MKKKTRIRILCGLLAALLTALCGCTSVSTNSTPENGNQGNDATNVADNGNYQEDSRTGQETGDAVYGGNLNVAVSEDPATLDPTLRSNDTIQIVGSHIFETVLSYDLAGNVHPGVCDYTVSEDGNVITLTVRDGVKFHDGTDVKIEDVQATLDRWFANISAAKKNVADKCTITYNDDSIVINRNEPAPLVLQYLSQYAQGPYVMPKEILEAAGSDNVTEYIGTGPYKFVEWQTDRYIVVERFDDYVPTANDADGMAAPKMAYCDTITFYPVADKTTRITGVQTGTYDVAVGVPSNMYASMVAEPSVEVYLADLAITPGLMFNNVNSPCADDVYLRQAIYYCLNMEDLMLASEGSEVYYYLNSNFMPYTSKWHNTVADEAYFKNDIEYAKELLAQSNYDGQTLVYLTASDTECYYNTALLAVDMMRQIGINVELNVTDTTTCNDLRTHPENGEYDMFSIGLQAKQDPSQLAFLSSDTWCGTYQSEKRDELYERLISTNDFDERYAIWEEFTQLLLDEMPIITFGERKVAIITSEKVHNIFAGEKKYYWNTWIEA